MRNYREIVVFAHPTIQALYEEFIKEKLKLKGVKDFWNVFKLRAGIGEGTYENWRKEFIRHNIMKIKLVKFTKGAEKPKLRRKVVKKKCK